MRILMTKETTDISLTYLEAKALHTIMEKNVAVVTDGSEEMFKAGENLQHFAELVSSYVKWHEGKSGSWTPLVILGNGKELSTWIEKKFE